MNISRRCYHSVFFFLQGLGMDQQKTCLKLFSHIKIPFYSKTKEYASAKQVLQLARCVSLSPPDPLLTTRERRL